MKFFIPTAIMLAFGVVLAWFFFVGQAIIAKENVVISPATVPATTSTDQTKTPSQTITSPRNTGIISPGSGVKGPTSAPRIIGPSSNPPNY